MDKKVTNKSIKNKGKKIIKVGYCGLQSLLRYQNKIGYNSGIYGWNCDFYEFDDCVISTGYRPIGESIDYNIIDKYENDARQLINDNWKLGYEKQAEFINGLLDKFIKEVM